MNGEDILAATASDPTTPKAKGLGKGPSFVPFSPYREKNMKVEDLKDELKQRSLPTTGKKEDLLRRLERDDDLKKGLPIYSNWKVTELKDEAQRRGLISSGLKSDLVTRLEESDQRAVSSGSSSDLRHFESSQDASTEPLLLNPDPSPTKVFDEAPLAGTPERRNLNFEEELPSPSKASSKSTTASPAPTPLATSSPKAKAPESPSRATPASPARTPTKPVLTPNRYELLGDAEESRPASPKAEKAKSKEPKEPKEPKVISLIPEKQTPKESPKETAKIVLKEIPAIPKEALAIPKETPSKPRVLEVTPMKPREIPASAIISSSKPTTEKPKAKVISVVPFDGPEKKAKQSALETNSKAVVKVAPETAALEKKQAQERNSLHLLNSPFSTVKYFLLFVMGEVKGVINHFLDNLSQLVLLIGSIALILGLIYIEGPYSSYVRKVEKFLFWYGGWVLLGVASSAGIGSGLHTFLLYLGPYIAQATIKAYACGAADVSITEDSTVFSIDLACNTLPPVIPVISLGILPIIQLVKWESFCWGAGTAIGELPPYFLARAAAMAGEKAEDNEEFAEIEAHERAGGKGLSLIDRAKVYCLKMMKSMGFFGIMLLASVPNPLFDLAGIFSGLLQFPFWKFFGATLIGKAVIKVSLQTGFIVLIFSKPSFELLLEYVHYLCHLDVVHNMAPGLFDLVNDTLEKNKSKYENPNASIDTSKSVFSFFFDAFFYVVLGICAISIIQSCAQVQLKRVHHRQLAKLERELEKKSKSS